jgi:hypothetical protein
MRGKEQRPGVLIEQSQRPPIQIGIYDKLVPSPSCWATPAIAFVAAKVVSSFTNVHPPSAVGLPPCLPSPPSSSEPRWCATCSSSVSSHESRRPRYAGDSTHIGADRLTRSAAIRDTSLSPPLRVRGHVLELFGFEATTMSST